MKNVKVSLLKKYVTLCSFSPQSHVALLSLFLMQVSMTLLEDSTCSFPIDARLIDFHMDSKVSIELGY